MIAEGELGPAPSFLRVCVAPLSRGLAVLIPGHGVGDWPSFQASVPSLSEVVPGTGVAR